MMEATRMMPTAKQIRVMRRDFEKITGNTFTHFYCPIMHEDRGDVELVEGHVLPQAVKIASRATVVQCKDVDNYYGTTLEPDMIDFVNLPQFTTTEVVNKVQGLQLVHPDGRTADAFFANPKSTPPFPQVHLTDENGSVISVFVKPNANGLPIGSQFALQGQFVTVSGAVAGAFIKAGYLALFRLLGYEWVFTEAGKFVADVLRQFFVEKATAQNAKTYFAKFGDPVHIFPPRFFKMNTLQNKRLLFHFDEHGLEGKQLWGMSPLFHINNYTFIVTLPANRLDLYSHFMCDWKLPHKTYSAVAGKHPAGHNGYGIHPEALSITYLTKAEFEDMNARGLTTGWECP
jgi:hypothetical protein